MKLFTVDSKLEAELVYALKRESLLALLPFRQRLKYTYTTENLIDLFIFLTISVAITEAFFSYFTTWIFWSLFIFFHWALEKYAQRKSLNRNKKLGTGNRFFRIYVWIFMVSGIMSLSYFFLKSLGLVLAWPMLVGFSLCVTLIIEVSFDWASLTKLSANESFAINEEGPGRLLSIIDSSFGHRFVFTFLSLSLVYHQIQILDGGLFDSGAFLLDITLLLIYFGIVRKFLFQLANKPYLLFWKFFTDFFESTHRALRPIWHGIKGSIKILVPSFLITSLLPLVSADLWLLVNDLPDPFLIGFVIILILISISITFLRIKPIISDWINQAYPYSELDIAKSAFKAAISKENNAISYPELLKKLEKLEKDSKWKLNEHLTNKIIIHIVKEYSYRARITLVMLSLLIVSIGFVLFSWFYSIMVPARTVNKWISHSDHEHMTQLLQSVDYQSRCNDDLATNPDSFSIFCNSLGPVTKMALLSIGIVASIFLLQVFDSAEKIFEFMSVTKDTVRTQLSLLIAYWWCIELGYQVIRPRVMSSINSNKEKEHELLLINYIFVICPSLSQPDQAALVARQIHDNQDGFRFAIFMSLSTYAYSPFSGGTWKQPDADPHFYYCSDISLEEKYRITRLQIEKKINPDNTYGVWDTKQSIFKIFESPENAIDHIHRETAGRLQN